REVWLTVERGRLSPWPVRLTAMLVERPAFIGRRAPLLRLRFMPGPPRTMPPRPAPCDGIPPNDLKPIAGELLAMTSAHAEMETASVAILVRSALRLRVDIDSSLNENPGTLVREGENWTRCLLRPH